ncbi:uncharacterized protein LOC120251791 [Dioscorea cayenensis subsp. rotundata]|uniref:Uncharacterized protein LOC120251791 n=1 Tax=Dioscorea cayennensis subsp. rotundata TaxID=55577 RepID=A0AB40ANN3_DIOCR|nr:uncharacterized protein LOC120251791 [Dioscorea cayenensis subsp. rotundata]
MELEAFPAKFCKGVRSYWRRRKYIKLESSGSKTAGVRVVRLGDGTHHQSTHRRFWRLKRVIKLKIKAWSPFRLMAKLRDAYIDAMLRLAGKGSGLTISAGPEPLWDRRIPRSRTVKPARTEFEQRLIFEIYRSLVVSGEIAPKPELTD